MVQSFVFLRKQFASRKRTVRRPPGTRYNERFKQQTMKHPLSVMICGAISTQGTAGLFFLDPGTTTNGKKYLDLMKETLELHTAVHNCEIFMHDGPPCHRAKIVTDFLKTKNIKLLEWPGNSSDLNPIENFWTKLKNRVPEKHPSSLPSLIKTIKSSWVLDMSTELCRNIIESMPRRIRAVSEAKGGHTKYWMLIFFMQNG